MMPHSFTFQVWLKSMNMRYLLEICLFFTLMVVFQYEISVFNADLHKSIDEIEHYRALKAEIGARSGLVEGRHLSSP